MASCFRWGWAGWPGAGAVGAGDEGESMRVTHFAHLGDAARARLFAVPPGPVDPTGPAAFVGAGLGATLYMPATRPHLAQDLAKAASRGLVCAVVCLEDAIGDHEVEGAQRHAVAQLRELEASGAPRPLVFVRVRRPAQVAEVTRDLGGHARVLTGFVLPKFTPCSGADYLDAVEVAGERSGARLLAMPVLESPELMYGESRMEVLHAIGRVLDKHRDVVAAVRIGATDLSAALGIRRPRELTVYDIGPVASVIDDIVNVMGRSDGSGYVISGAVWEYFAERPRLFKPQLRTSPFEAHNTIGVRRDLIGTDLDGLIREVVLDRARGMLGKTVIHPSHIGPVHALSVVSAEEYADAVDILGLHATGGGVSASEYRNKMNEAGPHQGWAQATTRRAAVFGVAADGVGPVDFLEELATAES